MSGEREIAGIIISDLEFVEEGVAGEDEIWRDKKTGDFYEVPITITRYFDEAYKIKMEDFEYRNCIVCGKLDKADNMIGNPLETLDCSMEKIDKWHKKNPRISLEDWFCHSCGIPILNKLEEGE